MGTPFTLCFCLSSGRKVTGLQVGKLTQTPWGKFLDSLSSLEDFSTCCWLFYVSESPGVLHVAHHVCQASLGARRCPRVLLAPEPCSCSISAVWERCPCNGCAGGSGLCCERKLCTPRFTGQGCLLKGAGGSVDHSRAALWKTSHSCWLLSSCPQSTDNARHMMCGLYSLKKKDNKPPSNCKLGYFFQTLFLQQILFGLIYEKPVTPVNVDG